jgi:hypothetical protein
MSSVTHPVLSLMFAVGGRSCFNCAGKQHLRPYNLFE